MYEMFKPNYTITNEILNSIAEIEAIRSQVEGARILPERAVELHYRATVEKVHSSTSIEGNPLTLKQVDSVLKNQSLTRHKYAEIEVRNYKKALDYIEKRKRKDVAITCDVFLELHELTMKGLMSEEKTGAFRKGPIYVVDQDDNVKYTGPGAKQVKKKLEELVGWVNSTGVKVHPCIVAAILHYQFASIHPFADGNGRTARLVVMYWLGLRGYDFNGSIVLDSYYAQERSEYYGALHKCQGEQYKEGQDLTSWVSYFISGFLSSAKVLWAEIAILSAFEPLVDQHRIDRDEMDMLSYTLQFGSISLAEAEKILPERSRRTLQRKLKRLCDNGYLTQEGAARSTRYVLP